MASLVGKVLRVVVVPWRVARRHTKAVLLAACLAAIAVCGGIYWYATREWDAARAALAADQAAEARSRLRVCLAVWPRSPEVHRLAARAARLELDFAAAEAHLKRCIELEGGPSTAVQLEFLFIRVQRGEADEVAPTLYQAVDDGNPESLLILETLARAYMHHLRFHPAYACLTRWIELQPEAVKPYHWRGWVYERLDHPDQAMADYLKVLELDPDRFRVRLRVAEMLLEDKKPQEAMAHLERLNATSPGNAEVQARLGQTYFLLGRGVEARRLMEAAVEHLPKDPALLLHLGRLDLQEGRGEEAERWLRRVLEVDRTDTEAQYTLANALQVLGRHDEADAALALYEKNKAILERANKLLQAEARNLSRGPDGPSEIGSLFLGLGRDQVGLYWLDQALKRNPDHQPTHKVLAEYYTRKGDLQRAEAHRRFLRDPTAASNR